MDYPYDLGFYSRNVTTASAQAQRWFDRGLNWCFGYHHEEAVACFEKALAADPTCAMGRRLRGRTKLQLPLGTARPRRQGRSARPGS